MNKLLNYGLTTLIGFSMVLPACTKKKTGIHHEAEKLSTWHKQVDETQKMTEKQKEDFKLLTANSEFHLTDESYADRGPLLMTDSTVTGNFVKNGDTVASVTLHKTMLIFNAESQKKDAVVSKWSTERKISWKNAVLLTQEENRKHADGNRSAKGQSYYISY